MTKWKGFEWRASEKRFARRETTVFYLHIVFWLAGKGKTIRIHWWIKWPFCIPREHYSGPSLLAITRQLLQLERCSNPPRIQQDFLVGVKKNNFQFCVSGSLRGKSQVGCFKFLWPTSLCPGRPSHGPTLWP